MKIYCGSVVFVAHSQHRSSKISAFSLFSFVSFRFRTLSRIHRGSVVFVANLKRRDAKISRLFSVLFRSPSPTCIVYDLSFLVFVGNKQLRNAGTSRLFFVFSICFHPGGSPCRNPHGQSLHPRLGPQGTLLRKKNEKGGCFGRKMNSVAALGERMGTCDCLERQQSVAAYRDIIKSVAGLKPH